MFDYLKQKVGTAAEATKAHLAALAAAAATAGHAGALQAKRRVASLGNRAIKASKQKITYAKDRAVSAAGKKATAAKRRALSLANHATTATGDAVYGALHAANRGAHHVTDRLLSLTAAGIEKAGKKVANKLRSKKFIKHGVESAAGGARQTRKRMSTKRRRPVRFN